MAGSPVPTHRKIEMKKLTLILAAFALAFGGFTATTASASAAAPVDPSTTNLKIVQVGTDAMGSDHFRNRNREFVDVKASAEVDITDLVVQDSWRKNTAADVKKHCNTFTVTADKVDADLKTADGKVVLPAGHTLRVYVGSGTAKAWGWGNRLHAVYMNHGFGDSRGCGWRGHFLNNDADTVFVTKGAFEIKHGWDWHGGYTVKP